jgi:hypothetical protein
MPSVLARNAVTMPGHLKQIRLGGTWMQTAKNALSRSTEMFALYAIKFNDKQMHSRVMMTETAADLLLSWFNWMQIRYFCASCAENYISTCFFHFLFGNKLNITLKARFLGLSRCAVT